MSNKPSSSCSSPRSWRCFRWRIPWAPDSSSTGSCRDWSFGEKIHRPEDCRQLPADRDRQPGDRALRTVPVRTVAADRSTGRRSFPSVKRPCNGSAIRMLRQAARRTSPSTRSAYATWNPGYFTRSPFRSASDPGSISVIFTLMASVNIKDGLGKIIINYAVIAFVIFLMCLILYVILSQGQKITKKVGVTGTMIINKMVAFSHVLRRHPDHRGRRRENIPPQPVVNQPGKQQTLKHKNHEFEHPDKQRRDLRRERTRPPSEEMFWSRTA